MIYFPPLRTSRLDVQLRELTMREAVALAGAPSVRNEEATSALLHSIVQSASGRHSSPARWTVQERCMVVAHYLACTSEAGANFSIGEGAFLDYLYPDVPVLDAVDAGEACGSRWTCRNVIGAEAEVMERACSTRFDWILADMAARLSASDDDVARPDAAADPAAFSLWLEARMKAIGDMPESQFEALFVVYSDALPRLQHLFALSFDAAGHVVLPNDGKEGGTSLAPARFPVSLAVGGVASVLGS